MEILIGIFVFCIVLFIYLHVIFQLRTSDDLEVYELDDSSKEIMEEICDMRQPVIFGFDNEAIVKYTSKDYIASNYNAFEVKVRDTNDTGDDYACLPLQLNHAIKLFEEDKTKTYFSENNNLFLQETGIIKTLQSNDEFIRPYMVANCEYDIMMGTAGSITPLRYNVNYRNYYCATQGNVEIKLIPPRSSKYLSPINDYENFEFRSPINAWNVQPLYAGYFDKVKCLEVSLQVGQTIYIPAYWWYSIRFGKNSSISCFRYRTYMNNVAILPKTIMYLLQNQNVKREVAKKVQTMPSMPVSVPVSAEATSPPVISSTTATTAQLVSDAIKPSDADGTNISELLNATPA
jgi:hypothetical protein